VHVEGRALGRGRNIFTAEGTITDASGKLLAHGTSTLMVGKR
jgi:acyl-coenzyme A thioesterase PaaI-like protein